MDHLKNIICGLAILAFAACTDNQGAAVDGQLNGGQQAAPADQPSPDALAALNLQPFANTDFSIKTQIPERWQHAANKLSGGQPVLNLFPKKGLQGEQLPLVMQTDIGLSHLDVFPQGHDTGFPIGKNQRLAYYEGRIPSHDAWDKERSKVYLLGNGEIWGYVLYPKDPPAGWDEKGFIFAQIAIENFSSGCKDGITGYKKDMDKCKPLEGDELVYYGRVKADDQAAVQHALAELEM